MSGEDKSEGVGKSGEAGMKPIGILAIGLIIGMVIGVAVGAFVFTQTQIFSSANALTPEEASEKAVGFITDYGVAPGVDVELINVTEVEGENLYKIVLNLSMFGMTQTVESYITKDGKLLFLQGIDIEEFEAEQQKEKQTIGDFIVSGDEICKEDGKPIIYFFGSDWCDACEREHPIVENVTAKFTGYVSFHDSTNDFTADQEIFNKYSTGGVPTLVLGCKYYRVGVDVSIGEDQEAKVLTALICNLTGNEPVDVCTNPEIEELINKI